MPKTSSKNTSTVKAFFNAIKTNNLTQLKKILSDEPQLLNTLNENNLNALHVAILHEQIGIVGFLVNEKNIDVNSIGPNNVTALHLAVRKNNYLLVRFLIQRNAQINCVDDTHTTPFHFACMHGHQSMIEFLVEHKANINISNEYGITPFHMAAQRGHVAILQYLIERENINIYAKTKIGFNKKMNNALQIISLETSILEGALELARQSDQKAVIAYLLPMIEYQQSFLAIIKKNDLQQIKKKLQENPNLCGIADKNDNNILHLAALYGHIDLVTFLVNEMRMDANFRNSTQSTPLHLAICNSHEAVARFFIEETLVDINQPDEHGMAALHLATQMNCLSTVKLLIQHNAIVNQPANSTVTPFQIAAVKGYLPIVQYLISIAKTNIYTCTKIEVIPRKILSCTALHLAELNDQLETANFLKAFIYEHEMLFKAIQANNLEQIKILDIFPALINNINPDGCYALHSAIKLGNLSIIEFLINSGANVNQPDEHGTTPLHLAIQNGYFPIVKLLIERDADITYQDKNGVTPMADLSYNDTLKIIKIWLPKRMEIILREHFTLPSGELTLIAQRWTANQQAMQATHEPVVIDLTTDESAVEYPLTSHANFFPPTSYLTRTLYKDSSSLMNNNPLNFSSSPQ